MTRKGPYLLTTSVCTTPFDYVYNGEFECLSGHQFWVNGRVDFGTPDVVDRFYKTRFGPTFDMPFCVWANCDTNLSRMCIRLTMSRCPERPGYHALLQNNQRIFYMAHDAALEPLRLLYLRVFEDYTLRFEELEANYANCHEKKQLRIGARDDLHESGLMYNNLDTWLKGKHREFAYVTWKLKLMEYTKWERMPRGICDLAVQASLVGMMPMEYMKRAQEAEPFYYRGGVMYFCKSPKYDSLVRLFSELYLPEYRYVFVYFSDDSCLSYWDGSDVKYHNIDIAKCDASQTPALFDMLESFFPERMREEFRVLRAQCCAPLKLHSTFNRKLFVLLRPLFEKLYSGSTVTTAINNMACILIGMAIADLDRITPEGIRQAAESAGYIITGYEPLRCFQEIQFLKHSPVWDGKMWQPLLNLGVLLRLSGGCNGDLPGSGPLKPRGETFQKLLLQGAYPRTHCRLIDLMKSVVQHAGPCKQAQDAVDSLLKYKKDGSEPDIYLDMDEIMVRYGVGKSDSVRFVETFGRCGFGDTYTCPVGQRIMKVDYDMDMTPIGNKWDGIVEYPRPERIGA